LSIITGTRTNIVTLVGNVADVTEEENGSNLTSTNTQSTISSLITSVKASTTTT